MKTANEYQNRATWFADEYGICEYHISGNKMIFYPTYPRVRMTFKAVVNLDTMKEEPRQVLKNYYPAYSSRIGGRYQACWDI